MLAPVTHALARQKKITLERLAQEPFIMREPGSGTRIALEKLLHQHQLKIKVRMELGSNEAIKQAIVGGLGISVLSHHSLVLGVPSGQLTILDVEHFPIKRKWYAAYPGGKQPTIVVQTFLEYLRTLSKQGIGNYATSMLTSKVS